MFHSKKLFHLKLTTITFARFCKKKKKYDISCFFYYYEYIFPNKYVTNKMHLSKRPNTIGKKVGLVCGSRAEVVLYWPSTTAPSVLLQQHAKKAIRSPYFASLSRRIHVYIHEKKILFFLTSLIFFRGKNTPRV